MYVSVCGCMCGCHPSTTFIASFLTIHCHIFHGSMFAVSSIICVSGRLAGENMTGAGKAYTHQSLFWSVSTRHFDPIPVEFYVHGWLVDMFMMVCDGEGDDSPEQHPIICISCPISSRIKLTRT